MLTRPTKYPEWASVQESDPISGSPNKAEPTEAFKQSGLKRGEQPFRPYFNYQFDFLDYWVKFLDQSILEGKQGLTSGTATVTIPDQGTTEYRVIVTPKGNVGSFWVTNDSSTQFTINTTAGGSQNVDWVLVNKQ